MTYVRSSTGRLSDLVASPRKGRADWSKTTDKLRTLEPGHVLNLELPRNVSMPRFRSTILTAGRRIHTGDWALTTRTEGHVLHCFLAPREGKEN